MAENDNPGTVNVTGGNRRKIDRLAQGSGFGRATGPVSETFYGIDHRDAGAAFQKNTDHQGLVLFTRPQLNLSYNNVLADRQMVQLLDDRKLSPLRAIRALLDPRGGYSSDLIDPKSAFIPLLSNTLLNLSGFPDETVNAYTSTEGIRKEAYSIIDDVAEINGTFDVTASFANIEGDPVSILLKTWARYSGYVYTGDMSPYPDMIINNEIDYQTRIWRLVLDKTKRYIKHIGVANAAFPMVGQSGAYFNYNKEQPYNSENDQISVPFRCIAAEYDDPILYHEFNLTVQYFNPTMADGQREKHYVKVSKNLLNAFNFQGYPRINLDWSESKYGSDNKGRNDTALELEWWVSKKDYEELLS